MKKKSVYPLSNKKRAIFAPLKYIKPLKTIKKQKAMTKAEIVAEIASKTGVEKIAVQASIEAFMESVKGSLAVGQNVYLRGFGSFIVKKRAKKTGRNISRNTTIIIPEHFIPAFKPAKTFINKVKGSVK
jgi:DNA-binding protein HU-beta